jgi:hypothetical protein
MLTWVKFSHITVITAGFGCTWLGIYLQFAPNVQIEWLVLLHRIREAPGSVLGPVEVKVDFPDDRRLKAYGVMEV